MDPLDQEFIALLRTDARASIATLAHRLGVSRGTVNNRITKLEDDGTIVGYTVRLRPDIEHNEITAWMSIAVEGNQTREGISILLGEPGIGELHDTNGRWDLLAEIRSANLADLAAVLERVRLIKGIGATETSIHLQSYKCPSPAAPCSAPPDWRCCPPRQRTPPRPRRRCASCRPTTAPRRC